MLGPLVAGFSAGCIHVLAGPDHLAAVAPLAAETARRPWLAGLLWGLGHAGGVMGVGLAALAAREVLPIERLSDWSERGVGLVLIGIGAWGITRATRQTVHAHPHAHAEQGRMHAHVHAHTGVAPQDHASPQAHGPVAAHAHYRPGVALGVGVLHGLAGSAHFLGVLPALAFATRGASIAYVAAFGAGTVLAMTGFAGLIGWLTRRFARAGPLLYRALLLSFSVAALAIGAVWLLA